MTADLCKVVDDRTVVAVGPGVPLQLHGVTSLDRNGDRGGLRALVARNVAGAKIRWFDEAWRVMSDNFSWNGR